MLLDALVARGPELSDVEIVHLHADGAAPHIDPEQAGHFFHRAFFVGANARQAISEGRASYVPIFLSDMPRLFSSGRTPVDVTMLHVSPPDQRRLLLHGHLGGRRPLGRAELEDPHRPGQPTDAAEHSATASSTLMPRLA